MKLKIYFRTALLLLAINLLGENLGYATHEMYRLAGLLCLFLYALSVFPSGEKTQQAGLMLTGWCLMVAGVLLGSGGIVPRLAGAALVLYGLGLIRTAKGTAQEEIPLLFYTAAAYFFFQVFYLYSPYGWLALRQASLGLSGAASSLLYSATFLGLPVSVLMFIFIMVAFFCTGKKKPLLFAVALASIALLSAVYLFIMGRMPAIGSTLISFFSSDTNLLRRVLGFLFEKDNPLIRHNYSMNSPAMLFGLLVMSLALILWGRNFSSAAASVKKAGLKITLVFLLCTACAAGLLGFERPGTLSANRQVVLYSKGFLNWNVPDFKMFGSKSAGMFGNVPRFLEAMGFAATRIDSLSREALAQAKILMIINLDSELPRPELQAIWDFVERGGSLLLLCDHTFYKSGIMRVLTNDILEPYRIRINFDSADWFVGGWLHSYQYASHPTTTGLRDDMNDAGCVIGASLDVRPPAFPIVTGKYGYSDPGKEAESQRGYLGNLDYDPGEPLGDVVLCAAQHVGRGKVMAFGDTSAFANAILVNSHEFINRVFTWLATDEAPKQHGLALVAAGILALIAGYLYLSRIRQPRTLLYAVVVTLAMVQLADSSKSRTAGLPLQGRIAYVDASHGERFSPESWNDNAIAGLHLNLMRNGYLSFGLRAFEHRSLQQADLLVLIAPSQPFSNKEKKWISDFVSRGGTLLLTVGYEERAASVPLLEMFGFAIDNLPLAQFISIISAANQKVRFAEAWPVVSSAPDAAVVASYRELPVIMRRPVGQGQVVVIGDSSFFWNQNLEMEENYLPENVQFLQWLLASLSPPPKDKP
jgi:hypothetical protein